MAGVQVVKLVEVGETEEGVVVAGGLKQVDLVVVGVQGGELGVCLGDHLVLVECLQTSELVPGGPPGGVMQVLVEGGELGGTE